MIPQVIHIGGEHTVTGSCHLLSCQDLNIMVDCGTAQGSATPLPIAEWPVKPAEINYLFVTHVHIDHIGRLPELISAGFQGEILCSLPSKALLRPMLEDSLRFEEYGKHQADSLLTSIAAMTRGFEYGRRFKLQNGVEFKLGRAGHILGSCFIHLFFPGTPSAMPGNSCYSIIFSGDLGSKNTPLLPDPDPPGNCDLLFLESTYGDRLHHDREQRLEKLGLVLRQALSDKGKVFIPAFALGRTQEILYEIARLKSKTNNSSGELANIPVFIDSPLGLKITAIYSSLSQFWDYEARRLLAAGDDPIDFANLYSSAGFQDHKKLLEIPGPAIIIAGSGMCTGGRILDHLAAGLSDPRNDLLFVGYQAKNTLGRALVDQSETNGHGSVTIDVRKIPVKAKIHVMPGYSAHADQLGLVEWVRSMPQPPNEIRLVHGEESARRELWKKLSS
ncbi:MAG: MBL fold metallo-hydrolase [Deltaproteobacteria bacterium RIFOXYD12_FULL_50_9]|nr:MAG: MBL fold metallo-hydrolase [Deltaproteobacteria bacterium RIFOXYD12_FULL_50_9]